MPLNQRNQPFFCALSTYNEHNSQSRSSVIVWISQLKRKQPHLGSCFPEAFGRQSFLPKEVSWPWAGFRWYEIYFTSQSMWYNSSGKSGLSLLVFHACLLLFLVHFLGIAMMRTLKGGICQCIKYVERHLRVKCNYTDTERGKTCLWSCSGREESTTFIHTTFYSLWQFRKSAVPFFASWIYYACVICNVFCLFVCFFMQTARFYLGIV